MWHTLLLATWCFGQMVMVVTAQMNEECDVNIVGDIGHGVIESDNFPFDYHAPRHCLYRIYMSHRPASSNRTICFSFKRFDLEQYMECWNDYLEFPEFHKFCGSGVWNKGNQISIISNIFSYAFCWPAIHSRFEIRFKSSKMQDHKGFFANFTVYEDVSQIPAYSIYMSSMKKHPIHVPFAQQQIFTPATTLVPDIGNSSEGSGSIFDEIQTLTCDFDPADCREFCFHGYMKNDLGCETCQCLPGNVAPCDATNYTCFTRDCVPNMVVCDGKRDCHDGSDESYSQARCSTNPQTITDGCTFENSACMLTLDGWERSKESNYGPRFDHTIGSHKEGYFVYSYFIGNDPLANLTSRDVPLRRTTDHCLTFWYFMVGYVGTLRLFIEDESETNVPVWWRSGNSGTQWIKAEVEIPERTFPVHQIMFQSEKGGMETDHIALDDIALMEGACHGNDVSCSFELGFCGWTNDGSKGAMFIRHNGSTPTADSGPDGDAYTGDGYYLLLEASFHQEADTARLISRPISHGLSGSMCLLFKFHMYGQDVSSLYVKAIHYDQTESIQWSRHGNQGIKWLQGHLALSAVQGPFQLVFEAVRGRRYTADIAVDDILLQDGPCIYIPVPGETTTKVPTAPVPTPTCPSGHFMCEDGELCVPWERVCDGRFDCGDFSDERNCGSELPIGMIVGIVVCVILAGILIFTLSLVIIKRNSLIRRHRRRQEALAQAQLGPVVSASDDPISTVTREPPPPYTYGDNAGYDASPTVERAHTGLPQLPQYSDAALPSYSTMERQRQSDLVFHGGAVGPHSVGGALPKTTPQNRTNLPTRPTLSGYGANTITISFSSNPYEPPPSYDIAIVARRAEGERRETSLKRDSNEQTQREAITGQETIPDRQRHPPRSGNRSTSSIDGNGLDVEIPISEENRDSARSRSGESGSLGNPSIPGSRDNNSNAERVHSRDRPRTSNSRPNEPNMGCQAEDVQRVLGISHASRSNDRTERSPGMLDDARLSQPLCPNPQSAFFTKEMPSTEEDLNGATAKAPLQNEYHVELPPKSKYSKQRFQEGENEDDGGFGESQLTSQMRQRSLSRGSLHSAGQAAGSQSDLRMRLPLQSEDTSETTV